MSIVLAMARRFSRELAALVALEALGAGLSLLRPVPLQIAVDAVVHGEPLPRFLAPVLGGAGPWLLHALVVLGVVIALSTQAQAVGAGVLSTLVGARLVLALRTRLFSAALRLSLARHVQRGAADTLYRIQCDAQTLEWLVLDEVLPVFTSLVTLAALFWALFRLSPALGAVGVAVAPPLLLTARLLYPALRTEARAAREQESRALAVVEESLGALPAVKAFGREEAEASRFAKLAQDSVRTRMRVSWLDAGLGTGVQVLCTAGTAVALFVGIRLVLEGRLTLGRALLALSYVDQIYRPLRTLGRKMGSLQVQIAGLSRALVLLDEPADVPPPEQPLPLSRARGETVVSDVTFAYDRRAPVLRGASLTIRAGERVGIAGETGAGKSTLLALLLRLYDPLSGAVRLDGTDVRLFDVGDLRRQFAAVFQETVLFQGTVAENIAMGKPGASPEEIETAARAANLHETIARFPDGYGTPVGERGHALSGGERQRVGLARAFLRDAPILILDEPTSALDPAAEAVVLEAMERLMAGRTVVIVSHRERALRGCDRVVRMEGGRLREQVTVHA